MNKKDAKVNLLPLKSLLSSWVIILTSIIFNSGLVEATDSDAVLIPAELSSLSPTCNESNPCNLTRGLTCSSEICKCLNPETMLYSEEDLSCKVLAGKPCFMENPVSLTLKDGDALGTTLLEAPSEKQLKCREGTVCDQVSKLCVCESQIETASTIGTCIPKATLDQDCSFSPSACREDLGLVCEGNICTCDPDKTVRVKPGRCVGKVGKPCVQRLCAENAVCEGINETFSGHCECLPETYPNLSGSCAKSYGIICNKSNKCISRLDCKEGACECPETQVYSEDLETCVAKVGTSCNKNYSLPHSVGISEDIFCVPGADCVVDQSVDVILSSTDTHTSAYLLYHCQCNSKLFEETKEGLCVRLDTTDSYVGWTWIIIAVSGVFIILLFGIFVNFLFRKQKLVVNALT